MVSIYSSVIYNLSKPRRDWREALRPDRSGIDLLIKEMCVFENGKEIGQDPSIPHSSFWSFPYSLKTSRQQSQEKQSL